MSFFQFLKKRTFDTKNLEIQLVLGKWQLDGKAYSELFGPERQIFEVLLAVEQICKKYNL
jgi:hypothetical protein